MKTKTNNDMKIELFTLCEGAFNTNGRLTIVNTFEDLIANQYPWRGPLGMALKLLVLQEEVQDYSFQIRIQNRDKTQTFHEMNAELKLAQQAGHGDVRIALATNIQGLLLPVAGEYLVVISVNGNPLQTYSFKALFSHA